ncbi:hypothetical protein HDU98_011991 [Podochytrium sp. JEL0797]|nr:hypothetical protein HDU98_011991 [Podochytrium sp. JEL0797]
MRHTMKHSAPNASELMEQQQQQQHYARRHGEGEGEVRVPGKILVFEQAMGQLGGLVDQMMQMDGQYRSVDSGSCPKLSDSNAWPHSSPANTNHNNYNNHNNYSHRTVTIASTPSPASPLPSVGALLRGTRSDYSSPAHTRSHPYHRGSAAPSHFTNPIPSNTAANMTPQQMLQYQSYMRQYNQYPVRAHTAHPFSTGTPQYSGYRPRQGPLSASHAGSYAPLPSPGYLHRMHGWPRIQGESEQRGSGPPGGGVGGVGGRINSGTPIGLSPLSESDSCEEGPLNSTRDQQHSRGVEYTGQQLHHLSQGDDARISAAASAVAGDTESLPGSTTAKPFKCDVCLKMFSRSNDLKRHVLTHKPEDKPHSCRWCAKKFSRIDSLRKHELSVVEGRRVRCSGEGGSGVASGLGSPLVVSNGSGNGMTE